MLTEGRRIKISEEYSVVLLPEPVGPVTSIMPCGRRKSGRRRSSIHWETRAWPNPEWCVAFQQAHHNFFAVLPGQRGNAQVDAASAFLRGSGRPAERALGDVHVRENFDARGDGILQDFGNALKLP